MEFKGNTYVVVIYFLEIYLLSLNYKNHVCSLNIACKNYVFPLDLTYPQKLRVLFEFYHAQRNYVFYPNFPGKQTDRSAKAGPI